MTKPKTEPARSKTESQSRTPGRFDKRVQSRPKHKFVVSHRHDADFEQGLRSYASYRDLGLVEATGGMARAHVIRFIPPFRAEEIAIPHYHEVDLQMIYVLKGWYKTEFEGEGAHTFETGSCWIQPSGIRHTVLGYSDDCELLEVVLPADFKTVTIEKSSIGAA